MRNIFGIFDCVNYTYISTFICFCLIFLGLKKYKITIINLIIVDFFASFLLFGKVSLQISMFGETFEFETGLGIKTEDILTYIEQ